MSNTQPQTLYEKVWQRHVVVAETQSTPGVMYVDLHLVHEVTSPQAFAELEARGLKVRRPDRTFATLDHSTPTLPAGPDGKLPYVTEQARKQDSTTGRDQPRLAILEGQQQRRKGTGRQ